LDYSVLQITTNIVSNHAADSKPVKQEVNGTVILPPLEFPASAFLPRSACRALYFLPRACNIISSYHSDWFWIVTPIKHYLPSTRYSLLKRLGILHLLVKPSCLFNQVLKLSILITFLYNFSFNCLYKQM